MDSSVFTYILGARQFALLGEMWDKAPEWGKKKKKTLKMQERRKGKVGEPAGPTERPCYCSKEGRGGPSGTSH